MLILLKLLLGSLAIWLGARFTRGAHAVLASKRERFDNPSKQFFHTYFYWFWGLSSAFWALVSFAFAISLAFADHLSIWILAAFPVSLALGMLVSWTYMPIAHAMYTRRAAMRQAASGKRAKRRRR